jgi:aminoglycoside 6'-N-acetyltransferase I
MESIITATENHLDDILEMGIDLWKDAYSKDEMRKFFQDALISDNYKVLLYLSDNMTAGFIFLSIRTDYVEGSNSSPVGYIEGLYVKPGFRKSGAAKKLLSEGEKWVKEKGCEQIGSDTWIENQTGIDFHIQSGFKEAGRLVTFIKTLKK